MEKITIYRDIKTVKDPYYIPVQVAMKRIKEGKSRALIDLVRLEPIKEKRDKLKMKLPSVCYSGTFSARNNSSLKNHSGLICLDFDNVKSTSKLKAQLAKDNTVYAAFISPSGNGVKALVRIPKENHLGSFLALKEKYPDIDEACKDVARVCYESYDPELYVNPKAKIFTKQIAIEKIKTTTFSKEEDSFKIYELIKKWLDKKGEQFYEGNRNNFLCKIISACNRFGIPKSEAERYVSYDYVNGSTNFKYNEFKAVLNGVYSRYTGDFGKASFERNEVIETETKKVISEEIIDFSIPAKDIIRLSDVSKDMDEEFARGIKMGQTTYFPTIDKIFRFIKGELTLLYGIGNHGKSEIMNQLMLLQSIHNGTKWAIFSPESYPAKVFYNKLIKQYVGKPVENKKRNKMSKAEYKEAQDFIGKHFFFLFPEEEEPTPEYIFARFAECMVKENVDAIVIDPYNQMYHDYTGRDDIYLSKFLTKAKRFAVMNDIYSIIVAHPNSKIDYTSNGKDLRMPYYTHQLAGGAMWGNKCDNILCYHRPYYKTDPGNMLCEFASQKIKRQDINGRPGVVELIYDIHRFCYKEYEGGFVPMEDVWGEFDLSDFGVQPGEDIKPNLSDDYPF